jgi:hypothetical protein
MKSNPTNRKRLGALGLVTLEVGLILHAFTGSAHAATPSYEASTMRAVKPTISATIAALQQGDLAAAKRAEQQYNILWHGVEVYLNFRSKPTYDVLEGDIQNRLETEMNKPDANAQTALGIAKELQAKFDEVIAISETGAPLNTMFDDLQTLRWNRAYLAQDVVADLAADNAAGARVFWVTFASGYPTSLNLVRSRNASVAADVETAFAAANTAFADPGSTIATLKPLAAAVNTKLGLGVSLLNAAARNGDAAKKKATATDLANLKSLNKVRIALNTAAELRRAQDPAAAAAAAKASQEAFAGIKPILAAKNGADVALATALTNVEKLSAPTTDLAAFEAAFTAAQNAILVAQQALVGQFWADAKVQKLVASLPGK